MENRREANGESERSWLAEVSWATRVVFFATLVTIGGFFLFVILQLFL